MSTQTIGAQVRWQDLKVRSEIELVLEIAKGQGWEDCELFGSGDMITQPQESMGWKLIPANLYEYSIPTQAIERLHRIINVGIRVRGVIIADDERRTEPTLAPAKPKLSLPSLRPVVSSIGNALLGFVRSVGTGMSVIGKVLLGIIRMAGIIALIAAGFALLSFIAQMLIPLLPVILLGLFIVVVVVGMSAGASTGTGTSVDYDYDPKLVILVDDGRGGTAWVSLFTWYD